MTQSVMKDNIAYLNVWMNYNPAFKENLSIVGNQLIWKDHAKEESVDISHFYLPEMLYNENFRRQIAETHELTGEDLFQIIKLYVQTEEMMEAEQKEYANFPIIENISTKTENGKEFLVITDSQNKKYRYDTKEPEKVINTFLDLKEKKGTVTLKEFGSVIQNEKFN